MENLALIGQSAGLFFLTFLSEDAATFGAALLASGKHLPLMAAFFSCFLGIWCGDWGLYLLARHYGRPWAEKLVAKRIFTVARLQKSERWFARHGAWALVACRFLPGSRLPTFLAAGLLKISGLTFMIITGGMAALWVSLVFLGIYFLGQAAPDIWHVWQGRVGFILTLISGMAALTYFLPRWWRSVSWQRIRRWEFWPAWLFYGPVILHYLWLSLKYRSATLPTISNPGIVTGGLVGESKIEMLRELHRVAPDFVAEAFLIDAVEKEARWQQCTTLRERHDLTFPFVLKPDIAQRGAGFKLISSEAAAQHYLATVPGAVVLQRYASGPHEAGIFYYRFPDEPRGRIFSITDKVFPDLIGDGKRTVEELIVADERAALVAKTYLTRWARRRQEVLAPGEKLRLVEAGNHAQGCIFQDGAHLGSPELTARIDQISQRLPGFFIGRYDVRYGSREDLRNGRHWQIVELNGAASEATHIYDARNSLGSAYRTLFQQWALVFAIGAANRVRGKQPDRLFTLWKHWRAYQKRRLNYPVAD